MLVVWINFIADKEVLAARGLTFNDSKRINHINKVEDQVGQDKAKEKTKYAIYWTIHDPQSLQQ